MGFQHDVAHAVARYFHHYKIDRSDAALPWHLLDHPLTLRMFCEVTNPTRNAMVGAEAMPSCLAALFDRYLGQVAHRVARLSPRSTRLHKADVHDAIEAIGRTLWQTTSRAIGVSELRTGLGDDQRTWDTSIVRALEQDGILLRLPSARSGPGACAVVYDALAGHIVADWLCRDLPPAEFETWFARRQTERRLFGHLGRKHPLAADIVAGLVGLLPRRRHRRHLWPLLRANRRTAALCGAARLEGQYLDAKTVSAIRKLIRQGGHHLDGLFPHLRGVRAAAAHPLNAIFLDSSLRPMPNADRDLYWTEWIRSVEDDARRDLDRLENGWRCASSEGPTIDRELLRARWIMWTLTTTVRPLRDAATRALCRFGSAYPKALFDLTLESLSVKDPYVPERMLAASYGVAMTLWADPAREDLRSGLVSFCGQLHRRVLSRTGANRTAHALMRDYATGVIELVVRMRKAGSGSSTDARQREAADLRAAPPPDPFQRPALIGDVKIAEADGAIRMDFGNYTIGGLIPGRGNYDFEDEDYRGVRRQIEARLVECGYSADRFRDVDARISSDTWRRRHRDESQTDRYGKKYAWIAFFEMYGLRRQRGLLAECKDERPSDADIDPSFPNRPKEWEPTLEKLFEAAPSVYRSWMQSDVIPEYDHLLCCGRVGGLSGPWVLLEGYIRQKAGADDREVFSFLRGVLVRNDQVDVAVGAFESLQYPGNHAIPEPADEYCTYAGEIPWSRRFASGLRRQNGSSRPDRRRGLSDRLTRLGEGVRMEVPVVRFAWESYHSELNQVSGVVMPAPRVCDVLELSNRQGEWDLRDRNGDVGSLYRVFRRNHGELELSLAYIRADLLTEYLARTGQRLVWFVWGERTLHHSALHGLAEELQGIYRDYQHIHARWRVFSDGRVVADLPYESGGG